MDEDIYNSELFIPEMTEMLRERFWPEITKVSVFKPHKLDDPYFVTKVKLFLVCEM